MLCSQSTGLVICGEFMFVHSENFNFIKDSGYYEIPYFQRKYVWDEDNWEQLIENFSATLGNHFLGSIILSKVDVASGESRRMPVIDGQQRLTTISVLLKVIYDILPNDKKTKILDDVINCLFQKNNKEKYEPRIRHSHFDKDDFEYVIGSVEKKQIQGYEIKEITSPIISAPIKNNKNHQIIKCYKYFYKFLSTQTEEYILNMYNLLCPDKSKETEKSPKMLVIIDLDPVIDNEQLIFDTINSTGVRLTSTDIIKNKLFQKLRSFNSLSDEDLNQFYVEHWENVFEADEESIAYWSRMKKTGRFKRQVSEILLHSIALIKPNFYDPEKNQLTDLPVVYKKYIDNLKTVEELKSFIQEIEEYAKIYRNNMLSDTSDIVYRFSDSIKRLLYILDKADLSTLHPYVLFLLKKYSDDKNILKEKLFNLELFVVRRLLAKKSNKNYNKDCKSFIEEENFVVTLANEVSNEEILAGIHNMNNRDATIMLFWLELHRIGDNKNDISKLQDEYTLEHIMPQAWRENWSNVPVKDYDNNIITDVATADIRRSEFIYSLGNMTLVTSHFNTSLRNYSFKRKIEGENEKPGYEACSKLTITTNDIINDVYSKNKENPIWDEFQIYERERKLGKEIISIWGQKSGKNELIIKKTTVVSPSESDILYLIKDKCSAKGYVLQNEHFVLMKGSKLSSTPSKNCPQRNLKNREIYKARINDEQITMEDIVFDSLSAAAGFVCLYSVSGPEVWKNKEGKKYKEI